MNEACLQVAVPADLMLVLEQSRLLRVFRMSAPTQEPFEGKSVCIEIDDLRWKAEPEEVSIEGIASHISSLASAIPNQAWLLIIPGPLRSEVEAHLSEEATETLSGILESDPAQSWEGTTPTESFIHPGLLTAEAC